MAKKYNRLLLTGAAGSLGTQLRPMLSEYANHVRLNDRTDVSDCASHEEFVKADLADMDAMIALTKMLMLSCIWVDKAVKVMGKCSEL